MLNSEKYKQTDKHKHRHAHTGKKINMYGKKKYEDSEKKEYETRSVRSFIAFPSTQVDNTIRLCSEHECKAFLAYAL